MSMTVSEGNDPVSTEWGHVTTDGGIEKYHYDFAGNVSLAEDANGNRTLFRYRGDNRIRSIRKENKSIKYFWYDREGRCSGRLDANANLVRTVYNMDGNPVMITGTRNVTLSDFRQRFHATADEAGILTDDRKKGNLLRVNRKRHMVMIKQEDLQKYVPQMASVHSTGMIKMICRRKCCMAMACGLRIHMMREAG